MVLSLVVLTPGQQQGQMVDVTSFPFLVGRDAACHFRPLCRMASRRHCAILRRDGRVVLRDLGSRNGTLVNGQRIDGEVELEHGDRVEVGSAVFAVCLRTGTPVDEDTCVPRARAANPGRPAAAAESGSTAPGKFAAEPAAPAFS